MEKIYTNYICKICRNLNINLTVGLNFTNLILVVFLVCQISHVR